MGGDTEFVEVSAKKRLNLDGLEEMICLVADTNEQKAQPDRPAVGTVIEAKLDRGRGAVASILVQNGTLRIGDSYIVGNTFGKVRAMFNDRGREIKEAGPSTPVEILGLESMPDAGDTFLVMADRDKAKGIAQYRKMKEREAQLAKSSRVSLEGLAEQIKQAGVKDLNLILKGDVQGSVEVLADSLAAHVHREGARQGAALRRRRHHRVRRAARLGLERRRHRLQRPARPQGPGGRRPRERRDPPAHHHLRAAGRDHQGHVRPARAGLQGELRRPRRGAAGLQDHQGRPDRRLPSSRDGIIKRDAQVRVLRDGAEVWKGKIASLKRVKDDVAEVRQGVECGIDLAGYKDIKAGDIIEAFTTEKLADELGQNSAEARKAEKAEKERLEKEAAAAAATETANA